MSWLGGVITKLDETLRRGRAELELELDEEIRFHLERETERLIAAGMDAGSASRQALRIFGGEAKTREEAREEYGFEWLQQTFRDLRHGARGLRRNPAFTAATVLTLGLAIGVTTATYSVVDGVLLEPLPYPDSDRLVRFFEQNSPANRWNISVADFQAVVEQQESFDAVAALRAGQVTLTGRERPERVCAGQVTADWFRVLGIEPAEGRGFLPGEDAPGAARVVVIGAAFRDRVFGPEGEAIGETIVLDGAPHSVVGILPPDRATLAGYEAEVWPVLKLEPPTRRGPFFLRGFARLRSGATLAGASADLTRISERIYPLWAEGFSDREARITPHALHEVVVGGSRRGVWLFFGAVGGILLIAIANVANLLLVRASARDHEMALRTSLGASRRRLTRQLLTESLFLATLGGLAAIPIAWVGLKTLVATSPALPRLDQVSLDLSVLAFASAITVVAGVLFGLAPLIQLESQSPMRTLRAGGRSGARSTGWGRLRPALVTAEFAIALPLLAGAALLLGSFLRLQRVDPGYDPAGLVSARVSLPTASYAGYAEIVRFWDEALDRVEAIPGVVAAGISTGLPPDLRGETNNFDLLDKPVPTGASEHAVPWTWASPGFLAALGVAPQSGRLLLDSDGRDSVAVVVVSRAWAERYYPGEEALGKQLYAGGDRSTPMTVVGIIGDVKSSGLAATEDVLVYEPFTQAGFRDVNLLVRSENSVAGTLAQVRSELGAMDPGLPLSDVQTMEARIADAVESPRYWTTLIGLFAGLGLLLAAIGVYGVLSYHVARQRREIGIRVALGAAPRVVRRAVFARGMSHAVVGIGLGVALAVLLTRWLESLLYGVSATDPLILGVAVLVLSVAAAVGCYGPALRATRIDPIRALRAE